jgi:hypothetical protein
MNGLREATRANLSFSDHLRRNRPPEPLPRRQSFLLEPLESRLLLSADLLGTATSTIVWANRGQASDNFDTAFGAGANAQAARAVIDAAIDAWNRVVVDFHHAAGVGGVPPDLSETISINLGANGFGASTSTTIGADGKPTAGSVTINLADQDGDGLSDWWVDPTPNDNSEFMGTINNAFTATAQAGSPASGRFDLFSVALAELTHNMGIANAGAATARYNTGGFTTDTGIADDAEGGGIGTFWLFQGPDVASLMTNNNGGAGGSAVTFPLHTAGPRAGNVPIVFGGQTVFGVDDNGNAVGGISQRTLVSNKTALILKDAYDYDIVMPETFGTFYSVLNETTGLLTVRGGGDNTVINNVNQGASSDNITITRSGDSIVVSVDVGVDVPGTGTGFAANDQQDAFVSIFDAGKVRSLNVLAGDGNDRIVFGRDLNVAISVSDGAGDDFVDFSQSSVAVTYTTGAGNDTVIGTAFNDTFNSGLGNDTFLGGDGSDTFTWIPGEGSDVIEGGDGNDVMVFNGAGSGEAFTLSAVGTRLQLFRDVGNITMDVAGVERVNLNALSGPDSVTVNDLTVTDVRILNIDLGADGTNNITVNGRTAADNLTVAVSTGVMTVTGLDYDVNVSGTTPADTLTVNGNAGNDSVLLTFAGAGDVVYTPTASDGGTFTSSLSPVTIAGTEVLIYDGQGNTNSLTIVGTGGADTIVHTPGGNDQAGSIQVDSLLALNYQNLGSGASLTVDGGAGGDTLVYNGTNTNDNFTIGGAGQVNLNSRLVLNTNSVEVLTLEGLNGDDTFTVVPAISASVYDTINLNGGGQASVGGDSVVLKGTGGDDDIIVDGPAIHLFGSTKTIQTNGIESISLDALGGTDRITYNGVSGVTENIAVSGSSTPGRGQISVPGVTLINFSSVDGIVVNGNPPTATETDTLTFAGTNAVDTFNINLAAAGSSADPILRLNNNGTTLLTLENYTNFNTLRVLGLDGNDTFNVFTADIGLGRNLFVDGGAPTGKKKATDNLNIFYTPARPSIIQSAATQDPDAGIVTLEYDTARFVVQYDDVEQVPPPKKQ